MVKSEENLCVLEHVLNMSHRVSAEMTSLLLNGEDWSHGRPCFYCDQLQSISKDDLICSWKGLTFAPLGLWSRKKKILHRLKNLKQTSFSFAEFIRLVLVQMLRLHDVEAIKEQWEAWESGRILWHFPVILEKYVLHFSIAKDKKWTF